MSDTIIFNARLVDRDVDSYGAILVRQGNIEAVCFAEDGGKALFLQAPEAVRYDARGAVLMPSFVDLHAHFREPGYTHKEDLASGSKAAASGGYGTVVLMANTKPVISSQAEAVEINERARKIGVIDVFQSVSLTRNFDGQDVSALTSLDASVVPLATEDGREVASAAVMLAALRECAGRGVIVSCHSEDPELAAAAKPFRDEALKGGVSAESAGKLLAKAGRLLRLAEDTLTVRNLALAAEAGCRVHIAHVSTAGSLEAVRRAKAGPGGQLVTCEAAPHHLALTDALNEIVNPPLRSESDREALITGLIDGTVDAIATDHAPHTAEDKAAGAPGFSGIATAFSLCYTALVVTGRIGLGRLSALMSANPAGLLGLKRGLLRVGYEADLALVDPAQAWTVNPEDGDAWFSKGKNTPLLNRPLQGKVLATFKRGRLVFEARSH